MSDVLIDLGEQRDLPVAGRPAPHRRGLLGAVAVVLLLLIGGGAYQVPPAGPKVIGAELADGMFAHGDRLFVVSAGETPFGGAIENKIISEYALPAGALLDRTTVAVTGVVLDVRAAGATILVSYQVDAAGAEVTVALIAGTGTARWRHPARLYAVSETAGVVLLHDNDPQFGNQHWYGVDLATGQNRWTLGQPQFGYTTGAQASDGFPARLVTAGLDGHVEVRDAVSGRLTARADVQPPPDWRSQGISMWIADDLVLLGGRGGTTAYELGDLAKRWSDTVDLAERYVLPHCDDALCVVGTFSGVEVLDPATGRPLWTSSDFSALQEVGRYLLADGPVGGQANEPQAVVDLRTGRRLGDFGDWRAEGDPRPDGTVVGLRQGAGQDVLWYAVLDPATRTARVLGSADRISGRCLVTAQVLVCRRSDASIGLWTLG
jgi:hypothetical protein